jgi:hypothetical protein
VKSIGLIHCGLYDDITLGRFWGNPGVSPKTLRPLGSMSSLLHVERGQRAARRKLIIWSVKCLRTL